ncbi:hypothetical protein CJU90_1613 [Yarrowia sp. C11]|nr:hypothetical protein CKK34_0337 [Yarrowia sp. E02]KAG5371574.1 hypothetical protein CJU90_1613 [Yarrowia sp. C11]
MNYDAPTTRVFYHELPPEDDHSNIVALVVIVLFFCGSFLLNRAYNSAPKLWFMFLDWAETTRERDTEEVRGPQTECKKCDGLLDLDNLTSAEMKELAEQMQVIRSNALRLKHEAARSMAEIQRELSYVAGMQAR